MSKCRKYTLIGLVLLLALGISAAFAACEKHAPTVLSTPRNLRIEDEILYWDKVEGAEGYLVSFNDEEFETSEAYFDIFLLAYQPDTYHMSVMALGDMKTTFDSEISEEVEFTVPSNRFLITKMNDGYEIEADPNNLIKGKLVIPNAVNGVPVTSISFRGFENCTELTSVILPNSISKIGRYAFQGCKNLTRIKLPIYLDDIPMNAFSQCSGLWDVEIPNSVKSIGANAFIYASSLKELTLSANVTELGDGCFGRTGLERIDVDKDNPVYRSEGNCIIRRADEELLIGCRTSKIPYGVKSIGRDAFIGVESTEIQIPSSVTTIKRFAFADSTLRSVELPHSITTIEFGAFSDTMLSSIELPNSLKTLKSNAFSGTAITRVVIPESVTELANAFIGCNLTELSVKAGNPVYYSKGNCVLTREGNVIVMGCIASEIPAEAEVIGEDAFLNVQFTEFVVPANIKEIGDGAFYYCSNLHSIVFSNGLKKIGSTAFQYCASLEGIAIPESLTEVASDAFINCNATLYLPWEKNSLPSSWQNENIYWEKNASQSGWRPDSSGWCRTIFYGCNLGYDAEQYCYLSSTSPLDGDSVSDRIFVLIPCRVGYIFAGWATEEDGEVVYSVYTNEYTFEDNYKDKIKCWLRVTFSGADDRSWINGDTLYAVWIPVE